MSIQCPICSEYIPKHEFRLHASNFHYGKLYLCRRFERCEKAYKRERDTKTHELNNHPKQIEIETQTMAELGDGKRPCGNCYKYTGLVCYDENSQEQVICVECTQINIIEEIPDERANINSQEQGI